MHLFTTQTKNLCDRVRRRKILASPCFISRVITAFSSSSSPLCSFSCSFFLLYCTDEDFCLCVDIYFCLDATWEMCCFFLRLWISPNIHSKAIYLPGKLLTSFFSLELSSMCVHMCAHPQFMHIYIICVIHVFVDGQG